MESPMRELLRATGSPPPHPLAKEMERRQAACWALTEDLRRDVILPLCMQRSYTFMAGNGTWTFVDRSGAPVDEARLPADVRALLEGLEAPNGYQLAAYCDDVTVGDYQERGHGA
jgi:hypothetical protein